MRADPSLSQVRLSAAPGRPSGSGPREVIGRNGAPGIVTDIQRCSFHDGPGIRTTVFAKGCTMRCAWCHNPETIAAPPQLQFVASRCIDCGACAPGAASRHAPADRVVVDGGRILRHDRGTCPSGALTRVGRWVTPGDVVREALLDRRFYENSGGGVTLSGGEILRQPAFAADTLAGLRDAGIHTAIETGLHVPWANLARVLPWLDLVIFDIKSMDTARHRAWTGVGNETILANARRLAEVPVRLLARTPVVPGFSDDCTDVEAVASFLAPFARLDAYELIPYHPLGSDKYRCLGLPDAMAGASPITGRTMRRLARHARRAAPSVDVRLA